MNYTVIISAEAERVLKKWKKSNPKLLNKFKKIVHELAEHPRDGIGHPEPLKGGNDITYSRRISAHDRVIYDVMDDIVTVLVITVQGHYKDK
jgi:toxin YoeB